MLVATVWGDDDNRPPAFFWRIRGKIGPPDLAASRKPLGRRRCHFESSDSSPSANSAQTVSALSSSSGAASK